MLRRRLLRYERINALMSRTRSARCSSEAAGWPNSSQMGLHHLGHQAVDRATDGGDLLQHRPAVGAGFQRAVKRIALAADAAHAGQDLLLLFGECGMAGQFGTILGIVYIEALGLTQMAS